MQGAAPGSGGAGSEGGAVGPSPFAAASADSLPDLIPGHPRYLLTRYINRGAHGVVMEALDRERNEKVALKFLERGPQVRWGGGAAPQMLVRRAAGLPSCRAGVLLGGRHIC